MKKLLSVLLAFILVFTVSASVAEAQRPEETLPDEHTEETKETDRSFTITVGVGFVYSVIIYKDSGEMIPAALCISGYICRASISVDLSLVDTEPVFALAYEADVSALDRTDITSRANPCRRTRDDPCSSLCERLDVNFNKGIAFLRDLCYN